MNNKLQAKNLKGLSLVELQIAGAILAGATLLIGAFYFTYTRFFYEEKTQITIASDNKNALDEVTTQIKESTKVATACTVCGADTTSSSTILILQIWPLDAGSVPKDPGTTNFDYIVYKLSGTDLVKNTFPSAVSTRPALANKILSSNIKSLLFEYDMPLDLANSSEVTITLTSEAKTLRKVHTYSQSAKALLRNK